VVPVNSGLHTRKNFSDKEPPFGHAPSECSTKPFLGRKNLKNISMKGCHIIRLPLALTLLGPALRINCHNLHQLCLLGW